MSHGQFGFDPQRSKKSRRARARGTIACWLMGRRHLVDDIDHALQALAEGREPTGISKRQMIAALKNWLRQSPHLPGDLQDALRLLLPEIGQGDVFD